MCGIIGYTGGKEAEGIIVDGLEILEYRGYDSAGIAVSQKDGGVQMRKCAGRVRDLRSLCRKGKIQGTCGIGHTRWATHGGVCDANAHPHRFGKVTVVHNGIIENTVAWQKNTIYRIGSVPRRTARWQRRCLPTFITVTHLRLSGKPC